MIQFFRKIRQKLLSEGNTGKYLKYAIGEIVLVVIGILIALSINNWNEKQKNREKEIIYLNRLTTNLSFDIDLYNLLIKKDSILLEDLNTLLSIQISSESNISNPVKELNTLITGYNFTSNRTTIENLISSGNIEIIRSNYLLEDIFLYYRTAEDIQKGIDAAISEYNRNTFGPFLIEFEQIDSFQKNRLINSVNMKIDLIQNQLTMYGNQKKLAESLKEKIKNELLFIQK